jgi:hypothetical protein
MKDKDKPICPIRPSPSESNAYGALRPVHLRGWGRNSVERTAKPKDEKQIPTPKMHLVRARVNVKKIGITEEVEEAMVFGFAFRAHRAHRMYAEWSRSL